jgi:protein SCO1/2
MGDKQAAEPAGDDAPINPSHSGGGGGDAGAKFVSWKGALIALLGVFLAGRAIEWRTEKRREDMRKQFVKTEGAIDIGGPYELLDTTGKLVTNKDLNDKFTLLYFGFSACPDICPVELMKMSKALTITDDKITDQIRPVFISLDPKRDTPERLAEYSKKYDPRIVWLTGSAEQIAPVAKAFRVYFSIPEVEEGEDDDYLVDHSIFFYLMDRDNKFVHFYGKNATPEEISTSLAELIPKHSSA